MNRLKATWHLIRTGECPMCVIERLNAKVDTDRMRFDHRADLNWIALELAAVQALRDKQHWRPKLGVLMDAVRKRIMEITTP